MDALTQVKTDTALLTPERLEEFLEDLHRKGRREGTLRSYRDVLLPLSSSLPEGRLERNTWQDWKREMERRGLQPTTINKSLSALNSYLRYIGRKDWRGDEFVQTQRKAPPELSRVEYRRLLSSARLLQKENAYLLLKLMGSFGIELKDLPLLTVEAVKVGRLTPEGGGPIVFTREMRQELMDYAQRRGITGGTIFRTGTGRPMDRKHIHWLFSSVCGDAQVAPEKVSPRTVLRMYHRTRDEITQRLLLQAENDYQQLLFTEQRLFGWDTAV